jgi:hypothetical protein
MLEWAASNGCRWGEGAVAWHAHDWNAREVLQWLRRKGRKASEYYRDLYGSADDEDGGDDNASEKGN